MEENNGLVETSTNIGMIKMYGDGNDSNNGIMEIDVLTRSCLKDGMQTYYE